MTTVLQAFRAVPTPRPALSDWLASLPDADRDALYAATRAQAAAWRDAERLARLRDPWPVVVADTSDVLRDIVAEVRGLRDDLLNLGATPAPVRPGRAPYDAPVRQAVIPKPAPPKPSGVSIPTVE